MRIATRGRRAKGEKVVAVHLAIVVLANKRQRRHSPTAASEKATRWAKSPNRGTKVEPRD